MLLREFLYFSDRNTDLNLDRRYNNQRDDSRLQKSDTRKVRLTLRQINQLRLQSEAHEAEQKSEMGLIKQMYGNPVEQAEAPV